MRQRLLVSILLVAAVFAVYGQVVRHDFVDYDDLHVIVHNEDLRPDSIPDALSRAFRLGTRANWIPLTTLSLQLDLALFGENAGATLLVNTGLHAAASVVFFLALAELTGALWPCAFAAGVFALHPLHVESVAWASARKDPLSGLFFALGLLAAAGAARRPAARRRLGVIACHALALLAKPIAVTFPVLLLLLDAWPLRRLGTPAARRRALVEKLPLFALSLAAGAAAIATQHAAGAMRQAARIPLATRVLNALDACAAYLADSVWPSGLAVFYPHPLDALPTGRALAAGALLAAITAFAILRRGRSPWIAVGWAWFLVTLAPTLGIVQVGIQARADRYTYLPLVGLAVALAFEARDRLARGRAGHRALALAGVAALALLGAVAHGQVRHWRDAVSLHTRAVEAVPGSFMEHHRLARALLDEGRRVEAEFHLRRSAELEPRRADPSVDLGDLLLREGRVSEAIRAYRTALASEPAHPRALVQLGLALVRIGQPRAAVAHYREALVRLPEARAVARALAWLLATSPDDSLRDPAEAVRLAELAQSPREPRARDLDVLAAAYASAGRFEDAVSAAREAEALAAAGDAELLPGLRARLALYREGRPYRASRRRTESP